MAMTKAERESSPLFVGINVRPAFGCTLRCASAEVEVAYHSQAVVENGWEPFDQPDPAAYLPRRNSELHAYCCSGSEGIVLLYLKGVDKLDADATACFLDLVRSAFRLAGATTDASFRVEEAFAAAQQKARLSTQAPAPSSPRQRRRPRRG
jgi:hypothetical protein